MVASSGDVSFWQIARYVVELRKKFKSSHNFPLVPCLIAYLVFSKSTSTSMYMYLFLQVSLIDLIQYFLIIMFDLLVLKCDDHHHRILAKNCLEITP
jgi:hypothetical protein